MGKTLINYTLHANKPTAPCVVLMHGLFGSLDNLSMLRKALEADFQVLSFDLPDHGKSVHTKTFSYQRYADLILDAIDKLGFDSFSLLGHSMGGKVAMQIALSQSTRVNKLIVLDIAPVAYLPRHDNVLFGLSKVKLASLTSRKDAELTLRESILEPGVRQFLLKSLYQDQPNGGWQWRFNLELLQRDYDLLSQAIESDKPYLGPTLFIKGEKSDYLQAQHRSAVLSLFPNSSSKLIAGTGHWLHAEKPDICARMVRDFLTVTE